MHNIFENTVHFFEFMRLKEYLTAYMRDKYIYFI